MTVKETMVKIHNEILERKCRQVIDVAFFTKKAANFKKKSPEYKQNMENVKNVQAELYWSEMLLKVIKKLIEEEK